MILHKFLQMQMVNKALDRHSHRKYYRYKRSTAVDCHVDICP